MVGSIYSRSTSLHMCEILWAGNYSNDQNLGKFLHSVFSWFFSLADFLSRDLKIVSKDCKFILKWPHNANNFVFTQMPDTSLQNLGLFHTPLQNRRFWGAIQVKGPLNRQFFLELRFFSLQPVLEKKESPLNHQGNLRTILSQTGIRDPLKWLRTI